MQIILGIDSRLEQLREIINGFNRDDILDINYEMATSSSAGTLEPPDKIVLTVEVVCKYQPMLKEKSPAEIKEMMRSWNALSEEEKEIMRSSCLDEEELI